MYSVVHVSIDVVPNKGKPFFTQWDVFLEWDVKSQKKKQTWCNVKDQPFEQNMLPK